LSRAVVCYDGYSVDNLLYGGIELGGTKTLCSVGYGDDKIIAREELPTTNPTETIERLANFFKGYPALGALGVGSFGPVDINPQSSRYGYITTTPKAGWANTDVLSLLAATLNIPIKLDTDVNCAALGEYYFGAARNKKDFVYLTIGTGIGGAAMVNGRLLRGQMHPEMGHIRIPHNIDQDQFKGSCPYHNDCFEGLASGTAIAKRAAQKAENVIDPIQWDLEANYLALGISNLISIFSPELVVVGGGVSMHGGLVEEVSFRVGLLLNSYVSTPLIVSASVDNALLGAIKLAA